MLEVLINLDTFEHFVIDYGELDYVQSIGMMSLGGAPSNTLLITMSENFTNSVAFTMCNYNQLVDQTRPSNCLALPAQSFSLSPFTNQKF